MFSGAGLMFKKMIIAKLAGNTAYEQICQAMKERILRRTDDSEKEKALYMLVWTNLYEKLKTVAPLKHPELE